MAASQVYPTPQLTIAGLLKRDFGTSFWTAHWRYYQLIRSFEKERVRHSRATRNTYLLGPQRQILRPWCCDFVFGRRDFRLPPLPRLELREPERDAKASPHQAGPEDQDAPRCRLQLRRAVPRKNVRHALAHLSADASRRECDGMRISRDDVELSSPLM